MGAKAGHRALRKGRVSIPGQVYLVTFVTEKRRRIFADFACARIAAAILADKRCWLDANVLCWVLMPDHWHGMIELHAGKNLAQCVNRAKSASAIQCNRFLKRRGRFWQKAFHDHALREEEELTDVARYVVANPLRAGLVRNIRDYPFWDAVWL